MMKRVCVICEGQTEETFVAQVLAPHFYDLGLSLKGQTVPTSIGKKGGALNYARIKPDIERTLKQKDQPFVTTLIDLYKLGADFPAVDEVSEFQLAEKLKRLTSAWHSDIIASTGCRPERFLPYIQAHEFEALLFSDVDGIVRVNKAWSGASKELKAIKAKAESPEYINNKPETKPAALLERLLLSPKYKKVAHGSIAMKNVGLSAMEKECAFFFSVGIKYSPAG
ncbi:MAG: DUF4276 family protein [Methyloprofundus sp.]|nr:DUF4276 family protein [Methyloprofundus sp.]MBW6453121.1 DUF4276 family protein [Methyloprofundus sp.]